MLGLTLKDHGFEVVVADPDPEALAASSARGLIPDGVLDPSTDTCDADVIVLAAPVPRIVELVRQIGPGLGSGQLLIDTGGAKLVVVAAMRALPDHVHAIGGHPMAGTEIPGPAGARPEALVDAPFILTPVRDDPEALAGARAFAEAVGARPVIVSAEEHDRVVARTSHLPHVLAFALAEVAAGAGEAETVANLSGTGFLGATRLAASDPSMVAAFLQANRAEVRTAMAELQAALGRLTEALDDEDIASALSAARSKATGS
jgi:prephenate dehydrogenase